MTAASILPPLGAPVDTVVKAVEAIVARGATVELDLLRTEAARRADLASGVAVTLLRQKREDDAIGVLRRFIDDVGPDPIAYDTLGAIHLSLDDAEPAMAAFRAALEIDPAAANSASNLYNLLLNLKRFDDAVEVRKRHPQAKDGAPERTLRAAQRLLTDGGALLAVDLLEPIEERPDILCALGEAYFRCGRPPEAHDAWERSLAIDPKHQPTLIKQAIGFNLQTKYEDALESIEAAEEIDGKPLGLRVTKAMILTELGRHDESIEILDGALDEEKEEHADGWAVLSRAYNQQGDGKNAKRTAELALALDEDNFFGRQNLVVALLRCHDNRAAEREANGRTRTGAGRRQFLRSAKPRGRPAALS
ncbi:MAG: tetratricopeptide repeat protein [Pseudomonadota bacterium]